MAFGQQAGPPATAKQVEELLTRLHDAGHVDFRDARGPMGFNQRQAAGRFTRDEASAFIDQLQEAQSQEGPLLEGPLLEAELNPVPAVARPEPPARLSAADQALRRVPAERLASELRRRGWTVNEP